MKIITVLILVVLGIYWSFDHKAPLPFNHEQFGLYQHNLHRLIGAGLLILAGLVWWKWRAKS